MDEIAERGCCVKCKCSAPRKELEDNSQIGSYGFKRICDSCAERLDEEMDSDRQDK